MTKQMPEPTNLALFFDCENVGLADFDVAQVMQWGALHGRPVIRRAYGDWSKGERLKSEMVAADVELVDMPSDVRGKNRADIRLVVDAMEILFTRSFVDTFVIISGDSDFIPLISRIRELGRKTIVVARRKNASPHIAAACDRFVYLDEIAKTFPVYQQPAKVTSSPVAEKEPVQVSKSKSTPESKLSDELLDKVYWAVQYQQLLGNKILDLNMVHSGLQVLFPNLKLSKYGFKTASPLRKMISLLELEGHCTLQPTNKRPSCPWFIVFEPVFLARVPQLKKPATLIAREEKLAKQTSTGTQAKVPSSGKPKDSVLPGPTIPNPFPVPSFAGRRSVTASPKPRQSAASGNTESDLPAKILEFTRSADANSSVESTESTKPISKNESQSPAKNAHDDCWLKRIEWFEDEELTELLDGELQKRDTECEEDAFEDDDQEYARKHHLQVYSGKSESRRKSKPKDEWALDPWDDLDEIPF